jgi:hypothetical protein
MESEVVGMQAGQRIQRVLQRITSLASAVVLFSFLVCLATFATGWWVFDGSSGWAVVGGLICATPVVTAAWAWWLVRNAARRATAVPRELQRYAETDRTNAQLLIDVDTGQPVANYSRQFGGVRIDLAKHAKDMPALYASVRALVRVPVLAAITILGVLGVGALGTILLIGGLID